MKQMVESIIDQAKRIATVEPDDYTVNGLVYCGVCRTPKQCVVNLFEVWRTVPCACQCMIKRIEQDKVDREQRRAEDHIKRLRSQGLQERYMSAWTFANDKGLNPALISKAHRYYKAWDTVLKDNKGLLLWGGVGTGKSYSAACIANALIDDGVPVLMTNMAKLINELSGFGIEDKNTYIASLDNYKLLIIDDLGIEANTDFRFELVFNIIDSRYKSGLPLIVTTNLTVGEMQKCTDIRKQRVYDRILEMCVPIVVDGPSLRQEASARKIQEAKELFR